MGSPNNIRIRFLGGAGTVTGSKYLLNAHGRRVLVDCGLFQGLKELRIRNWDRFPVDPRSIDAIILTHAHIDHSGYIPRLVKDGFRGRIYCTPATFEVVRLLLLDTAFLQEEEAEYLNRKRLTKHSPALPLFSRKEAEDSFKLFVPRDFGQEFQVGEGLRVCFHYAGHILGAAMATVHADSITIGFSGDVGRLQDPVFQRPHKMPEVDYLVVESTYGNRRHPDTDPALDLEKIVNETCAYHGVVLIPAFAVGRAQTLMYLLSQLRKSARIPPGLPMYLNSPLAESVTDIFCRFHELHKLNRGVCDEMMREFHQVHSAEESRRLNEKTGPMVIISASGMATGGRILHHLRAFAGDPKTSIVLAGYQAAGTRGRALQDGARTLRIHGQDVQVNAQVCNVENLSAHADYLEIIEWLKESRIKPKKVFVTHGEPDAANAMVIHLADEFGWTCEIPHLDYEATLT